MFHSVHNMASCYFCNLSEDIVIDRGNCFKTITMKYVLSMFSARQVLQF